MHEPTYEVNYWEQNVETGENEGMTKNTTFFGNMMGVNNIREIKKLIEN